MVDRNTALQAAAQAEQKRKQEEARQKQAFSAHPNPQNPKTKGAGLIQYSFLTLNPKLDPKLQFVGLGLEFDGISAVGAERFWKKHLRFRFQGL